MNYIKATFEELNDAKKIATDFLKKMEVDVSYGEWRQNADLIWVFQTSTCTGISISAEVSQYAGVEVRISAYFEDGMIHIPIWFKKGNYHISDFSDVADTMVEIQNKENVYATGNHLGQEQSTEEASPASVAWTADSFAGYGNAEPAPDSPRLKRKNK